MYVLDNIIDFDTLMQSTQAPVTTGFTVSYIYFTGDTSYVRYFGIKSVCHDLVNKINFKATLDLQTFYANIKMYCDEATASFLKTGISNICNMGYLPLKICSIDEEVRVNFEVPVVSVENTEPEFAWLVEPVAKYIASEVERITNTGVASRDYYSIANEFREREDLDIDASELLMCIDKGNVYTKWNRYFDKFADYNMALASFNVNGKNADSSEIVQIVSSDTLMKKIEFHNKYLDNQGTLTSFYDVIRIVYKSILEKRKGTSIILQMREPKKSLSILKEILDENKAIVYIGVEYNDIISTLKSLDNIFGSTELSNGLKRLNNIRVYCELGRCNRRLESFYHDIAHAGYTIDNVLFGVTTDVSDDFRVFAHVSTPYYSCEGTEVSIKSGSLDGIQMVVKKEGTYTSVPVDKFYDSELKVAYINGEIREE